MFIPCKEGLIYNQLRLEYSEKRLQELRTALDRATKIRTNDMEIEKIKAELKLLEATYKSAKKGLHKGTKATILETRKQMMEEGLHQAKTKAELIKAKLCEGW